MNEDLKLRLANNEAVFRDVNEAIARGQWPGEEDSPGAFRCECARADCNSLVQMTVRDYERVRSYPRRFLVLPGHQVPEIETVVDTQPGYVVVEKLEDEAGQRAEDSDPRD